MQNLNIKIGGQGGAGFVSVGTILSGRPPKRDGSLSPSIMNASRGHNFFQIACDGPVASCENDLMCSCPGNHHFRELEK